MHVTIGSSGASYHHHSDFSGDVMVTDPGGDVIAAIPFADMLELVGEYYQSEAISKIEQMSRKEYLDSLA